MAFLSKEDLRATADYYGIDIDGDSFAQAQGHVSRWLAQTGNKPIKASKPKTELEAKAAYAEPKVEYVVQDKPHLVRGKAKRIQRLKKQRELSLEDLGLAHKRILMSPEIAPTRYQLHTYQEDLGEDMEVEEIYYDGQTLDARNTDRSSGTYRVRTRPGTRIYATSALPKENVELHMDPEDMFTVARFQGREGYLWTHPYLPSVKPVLKASGYYQMFKDQLKDEPNIFYLGGKVLAVDKDFCHYMMKRIEDEEARRNGGR